MRKQWRFVSIIRELELRWSVFHHRLSSGLFAYPKPPPSHAYCSVLLLSFTYWLADKFVCYVRTTTNSRAVIEVIYKPRLYFVGLAAHIMTITTSRGTVEYHQTFQSNRKFIIMLTASWALCTAAARGLLNSFTVTSRATWTEKIMFSFMYICMYWANRLCYTVWNRFQMVRLKRR